MEKFYDSGFHHSLSDTGHHHPLAFSRAQIAEAEKRELIEDDGSCAPVPRGMLAENDGYFPNRMTWPLVLIEAQGN